MNSNLKILLGGVVGAGIGWFIGSVIVDIIDIKQNPYEGDYYEEEYPEETNTNDEKELFERTKVMPKKGTRNYAEAYQENPDLKKLIEKYKGIEDPVMTGEPEDVINAENEFESIEDDVMPAITVISMDEFVSTEGFEAVTLNYYDDEVVTDQHDNVISHPEAILGDEALVSFGELSGDEDVVYVRNLEKRAMYEVVRTNKEYAVQKARRDRKRATVSRLKEGQDGEEDSTD